MDRRVARLFAARARMEAVELNKAGDFRRATRALRGAAYERWMRSPDGQAPRPS